MCSSEATLKHMFWIVGVVAKLNHLQIFWIGKSLEAKQKYFLIRLILKTDFYSYKRQQFLQKKQHRFYVCPANVSYFFEPQIDFCRSHNSCSTSTVRLKTIKLINIIKLVCCINSRGNCINNSSGYRTLTNTPSRKMTLTETATHQKAQPKKLDQLEPIMRCI